MDEIRVEFGNHKDYDEYMRVINESFHFESFSFLQLLPKLYKKEYYPCEKNITVTENGKMQCAVGVYFQAMQCLQFPLQVVGIGNVAVLPEARRKGYMKLAMKKAVESIINSEADFAFLGGQRQRYEYFHFYPGGIGYTFTVNRDNLRHVYGALDESGCEFRRFTEKDESLQKEIKNLNEFTALYTIRKENSELEILSTWCDLPYAFLVNGQFAGYAVLETQKKEITEILLKNPQRDLPVFLQMALKEAPDGEINICIPEHLTAYYNILSAVSEGIGKHHSAQYMVLNYKNTLQALLSLKASYQKLTDGSFTCEIKGLRQTERLFIGVKQNRVCVEDTEKTPQFFLTQKQASLMFLDMFSSERLELPPECASWFPLPLCISNPDHV